MNGASISSAIPRKLTRTPWCADHMVLLRDRIYRQAISRFINGDILYSINGTVFWETFIERELLNESALGMRNHWRILNKIGHPLCETVSNFQKKEEAISLLNDPVCRLHPRSEYVTAEELGIMLQINGHQTRAVPQLLPSALQGKLLGALGEPPAIFNCIQNPGQLCYAVSTLYSFFSSHILRGKICKERNLPVLKEIFNILRKVKLNIPVTPNKLLSSLKHVDTARFLYEQQCPLELIDEIFASSSSIEFKKAFAYVDSEAAECTSCNKRTAPQSCEKYLYFLRTSASSISESLRLDFAENNVLHEFLPCSCSTSSRHIIRKSLNKVPDILLVNLGISERSREKQTNNKLMDPVALDYHLDLSGVVSENQGHEVYELLAVIVHIGRRCSEGHYVTVLKKNDRWYLFDDDKTPKEVLFKDFLSLSTPRDCFIANGTPAIVLYEKGIESDDVSNETILDSTAMLSSLSSDATPTESVSAIASAIDTLELSPEPSPAKARRRSESFALPESPEEFSSVYSDPKKKRKILEGLYSIDNRRREAESLMDSMLHVLVKLDQDVAATRSEVYKTYISPEEHSLDYLNSYEIIELLVTITEEKKVRNITGPKYNRLINFVADIPVLEDGFRLKLLEAESFDDIVIITDRIGSVLNPSLSPHLLGIQAGSRISVQFRIPIVRKISGSFRSRFLYFFCVMNHFLFNISHSSPS